MKKQYLLLVTFLIMPLFEVMALNDSSFAQRSEQALRLVRGGDIVGNGGGHVEQNFHYIYKNLDRYITHCLNRSRCSYDQEAESILRKMRSLILEYRNEPERLVFMRSQDFDAFFMDQLDPSERIAKTGHSPEYPIFINLNLVQESRLGTDLAAILSLLIHEVGHQVGKRSHSYLDDLAARVRSVFEEYRQTISLQVSGQSFEFSLFEGDQAFDYDELLFFYNDTPQEIPKIESSEFCETDEKITSLDLSNAHWIKPPRSEVEGIHTVGVGFWAEVECDGQDREFYELQWSFHYSPVYPQGTFKSIKYRKL